MPLTTTQLQTLKAAILADPVLAAQPNTGDGNFGIAAAMNLVAMPQYVVWRTTVTVDSIMSNGFDWTRVDNATVGKARIWEWMTQLGVINPSKANVRAGLDEAWSGAQNAAHLAAIYIHCKRDATRFEKLFATGTGTTISPATMAVEGAVSPADVETARNLP